MKEWLFKIVGILLALLGGFAIGWNLKPVEIKEVEVEKVVKEYITPEPVEKVIEKVVKVPVEKVIYIKTPPDTVKVTESSDSVEVRWESKHYSDYNYDLYISGILPQVDSLKIYEQNKIYKETIYKDRLELGPYIDGTFTNSFTSVSAGLELGVPYKGWEFAINGGYGISITESINKGWFVGARVKYNILYR